ncbi:hypothetical protein ACIPCF_07970 [Paracoccus marcusii]|uniref:hypothetical protein n=1 Tax=Paracoccus marcusii TaxID=59779 RepID=UPI002491E5A8|nr:hypothetical protein [Paracoccus marcusii]
MALKRSIEVTDRDRGTCITIGDVSFILRRIGERTVSVVIDADRSIPISITPELRTPGIRY